MSKTSKSKKLVNPASTDENWDDILSAEIAKNVPVSPVVNSTTPKSDKKLNEDEDDDDEEEEEKDSGASKKDKKKKKKKKPSEKSEGIAVNKPISATAQAILLQQQRVEAENARVRALQEEQDRIIREEEEREAAEEKAIEDEKERKRKAKQDKLTAQKQAGTYMTKAEKEKAKKSQARLDQMKASGLLDNVSAISSAGGNNEQTKIVYSSNNKNKKKTVGGVEKSTATTVEIETEEEEESVVVEVAEKIVELSIAASVKEEIGDVKVVVAAVVVEEEEDLDWENDDFEVNIVVPVAVKEAVGKVNHHLQQHVQYEEEEEEEEVDLIALERQEKEARDKKLGLERRKRDEELRLKREREENERAELDRQAREAAIKKEESRKRRTALEKTARDARSADNLRAAISCIMGHVDTGKTKLLDKIRNTNVQEGEAGGITQQIGATHFPRDTLILQTQCMQPSDPFDIRLPGLLVIDTPGHESFTNLRNRGSSLCDIAILVIDLMHGLEPQTIESINLLTRKNAPFIVALNKVDRLYGWKKLPDGPIRQALAQQDENCRLEFKDRTDRIVLQLNKLGLNAKLYWENDSLDDTVSLVPTSALSGEGVPDLLMNLIRFSQSRLEDRLKYMEFVQCTVLEVKIIEGLGPSIDVVLLNGTLREGDKIVISTLDGPQITTIRALLTPPPNREMRIKSEYIHHTSLQGAMGVKIVATDLQRAVAGTPLMVIYPEDDLDDVMEDVQSDLTKVTKLETDTKGVSVHASTLGALEALLQFLREECKPAIPVSTVSIGTIFKRDVIKANLMNEKKKPEYATILAFDVRVDPEAIEYAEECGVRIFTADIIYHLFDQFTAYMNELMEKRRAEALAIAVHPCILKIFPHHVFNKKDPIVLGVEVVEGTLKLHTPLHIPLLGLDVGRVASIENNHKEVQSAKKGANVAVKITNSDNPNMMYGRQFDHTSLLYSKISRDSIDALKEFFKDDITKEDLTLLVKLKKIFQISDSKPKKASSSSSPRKGGQNNADEDEDD